MRISPPPAAVDAVIATPLLLERTAPPRDLPAEHAALTELIGQAATDSTQLLPRLVELAVHLCDAGSAGVSLLEPAAESGEGVFRWVALAGAYREYVGGTTPESFSPCGTCLARGTPQLYRHPARLFTYLAAVTPPLVEGLVIPLRSAAGPLGTIWIVSHSEERQFTAADVAIMASLADFTSAALALQRGRDQAVAASRARDEFLAVVSHELRRPLTAIVGWAELLLAGRATAVTAARAIEALHTNARRQQGMIEDLCDASRAFTGSLRLSDTSMDLASVVRAAVEVVGGRAAAGSVHLTLTAPDTMPFQGDPDRLLQVVGNLLDNAVKFTPAGGRVMIDVTTPLPWVSITVRDTGIGIAPEMLPVVFDVFRQADTASTRRDTGLGLGLTIARRLAGLHGGTLDAHSDGHNRGAAFTVRLPADRLRAQARPPPPAHTHGPRRRQLSGITVLVVDDEPDVRDVLACVLEDLGAAVVTAGNVADARSMLARQAIAILLTDLVMPEEDGFDLLEQLRESDSISRPVATIAVTALASAHDRQRVLDAGFDHHVAKPIDFDALVRLIDDASRQGAHS